MRRVFMLILSGLAGSLALVSVALAKGPDPADYPLRVHILANTTHSHHNRETKILADMQGYLNGAGGADLFENGEPQGFEFTYNCIDPLRASGGYETYPARWKKKEKTLQILIPQPGKPWNMDTCDLQVEMRPGLAYSWNDQDDAVLEESAAAFKDWMAKHQYDPEKGRDLPMEPAPASKEAGETGSSSSEPAKPQ